jgi:Xaa-Pro aminopeptidase
MRSGGVDVLLAGPSSDYRWLTGLDPPIPTRLTFAVVTPDEPPRIVTPRLEAPHDPPWPVVTYLDSDDPYAIVIGMLGDARRVAVTDRTWVRYLLGLASRTGGVTYQSAAPLIDPLRAVKDPDEQAALRASGQALDRVLASLAAVQWRGRSERQVARTLADALLGCGHDEVHDVIVAAGANGANPHHTPTGRIISDGDAVVVDLGGGRGGYASDATRMVVVGSPPAGFADACDAVRRAYNAALATATVGSEPHQVDAAARRVLDDAGLGDLFVHRTGHGIGLDVHEAPSITTGATDPLQAGMAFSIEPGVYLPGRFGVRLENIVLLGSDGAMPVTTTPLDPIIV